VTAAPTRVKASGARDRFLTDLTIISTPGGLLFGYDTSVIPRASLYMRSFIRCEWEARADHRQIREFAVFAETFSPSMCGATWSSGPFSGPDSFPA
jgi:hypothetical protein